MSVLARSDQDALGIFQQHAFDEQECAVFFESTDKNDIFALSRITGLAPLQFFVQLAVKKDPSQLRHLFLPLFGFP